MATMSDEQLDDSDFFQQDFTTASEWEVFNARLEEQIHEWKLPFVEPGAPLQRDQLSLADWHTTEETVTFADVEILLTRYRCNVLDTETAVCEPNDAASVALDPARCGTQAFIDLMSAANNYALVDEKSDHGLHPIARWYGLRDFVVVAPVRKPITNESQIRVMLSSLHIAVAESACAVPVFFQTMEPRQHVYAGVCESRTHRLTFDVIHLRAVPPPYKYLTGLLDMFKSKVGTAYLNAVQVSVRLTYSLTHFASRSSAALNALDFETAADLLDDADEANADAAAAAGGGADRFQLTPYRCSIDPMTELLLFCVWPQVADNVVIDSPNYTDFDPLRAPVWRIRCRFDAPTICRMSECLGEFMQRHEDRQTLGDLLGNGFNMLGDETERNPFDILTESKITNVLPGFKLAGATVSSGAAAAKKSGPNKLDGPISEELLMQMLYFMFPDAQKTEVANNAYVLPAEDVLVDPMRIKSAHIDSLVHRLSVLLAMCNSYFGGKRAVAQLWAEFTQEMRYRVERSIQIPGVAGGFPDSRTCLLHQKLQMLNVCMERRRIREGGLPFAMTKRDESAEEDDEFYDCSTEDDDDKHSSGGGEGAAAPWNRPEGRLSRLGEHTTLVGSDEPLYVPVTQEPVPKTEDQLERDAEVMLQLGPDNALRLQMMSASLLSDMASFKAANLNGQIEDFIRWYSPRDWIVDDNDTDPGAQSKGALSSRMQIPGNTWQLVWDAAKPVPARRQKRLFDDTMEAEKILHYFEAQTIGQIVRLTLVALVHTSIVQMREPSAAVAAVRVPNFGELHDRLVAACCKLSREAWSDGPVGMRYNSAKRWSNLLADITNVELLATKSRSLLDKLFEGTHPPATDNASCTIVNGLLLGYDVELPNGAQSEVAQCIRNMFAEAKRQRDSFGDEDQPAVAQMTLPSPVEKQFTLRLSGKTVSKGMGGPQFLRAVLGTNEFRLCGAFSQDITFF